MSNYTDANHKPEIAIAISTFEAFCGFKPVKRIGKLLELAPLRRFRSPGPLDDEGLKSLVLQLLTTPSHDIASIAEALSKEELGEESYIRELLPRLREQYGTEVRICRRLFNE